MARGKSKATEDVVREILQTCKMPILRTRLYQQIHGIGYDRFKEIVAYLVSEKKVKTVPNGADEYVVLAEKEIKTVRIGGREYLL